MGNKWTYETELRNWWKNKNLGNDTELRNGKKNTNLLGRARIDHAHHGSLPKLSLNDALAFDKAVKVARKNTAFKDTLMIVTADHSHVFTISGYPTRGVDILGLEDRESPAALDGKPRTILQYSNGPAYAEPIADLTGVDTIAADFQFPSGAPLRSETHGGEDVAIYASGPMSHLINGVKE